MTTTEIAQGLDHAQLIIASVFEELVLRTYPALEVSGDLDIPQALETLKACTLSGKSCGSIVDGLGLSSSRLSPDGTRALELLDSLAIPFRTLTRDWYAPIGGRP
jgi:hypothetical protein